MRDFFLTSAMPYWLLFALAVASVGYCAYIIIKNTKDDAAVAVSQNQMSTISGLLLLDAIMVIAIYAGLGGYALWWVTGKDISYWGKLLRIIPLIIFLVVQAAAPFAYNLFMKFYFRKESLTVKSQFIALVVVVPVALIVTRFFSEDSRDLWFYIIAGAGLAIAMIYSAVKNSRSIGTKSGLVYTLTSFVLCAATLITLLYLIVAFFSLIFEMLPVIATIIGVCFLFSKTFGNAVMNRDDAGNYIASDGSKHSSQSARDTRNSQIHSQMQKNS